MSTSLSDLPNFVANAFRLEPTTPFVPENTVLGFYTFLPWVRTGIAAAVTAPPAGSLRASVTVSVAVQGAATPAIVEQTLVVRGPGDVLNVHPDQIIRRSPERNATGTEDTFLAHIEFDRPDFPWIFTPAQPSADQLPPWLALVVLRGARADLQPGDGKLPPRVTTKLSELQPLTDSWAWAHAQVIGPAGPPAASIADRLSPDYSAVNLSRLLCPRRLLPDESYLACLVPAFDAGVQAGLDSGQPGTLDPAWERALDGSDAENEIVLPVYHSWKFTTGDDGDFRSLAELLQPVVAPWQVGRRLLDASHPGGELPPLASADDGALQTVHGPLVSPQKPSAQSADPVELAAAAAESASWPAAETEQLRDLLDEPDRLAGEHGALAADALPRVGPEIYARHQAGQSRVGADRDADWFGELNLRAPNRVAAGLGTRVVQRDQEQLMQAAWTQAGELDDTNRQLRTAQLARFVGTAIHEQHLGSLPYSALLQVTRPVHGRVLADAGSTIHAVVSSSAVAPSSTGGAFRRSTRPRGPLARFAPTASPDALQTLLGSEGATRDFQRPYADLDGVGGISEAAARAIDPSVAARVLGLDATDPEGVVKALVAHGAELAATPAVPDMLTPEAVRTATPEPAFSPSAWASDRLVGLLQRRIAVGGWTTPAQSEPTLSLLGALARVPGPAGLRAAGLGKRLTTTVGLRSGLRILPHGGLDIAINRGIETTGVAAAASLAPIAADLVAPSWPVAPDRPALVLPGASLLSALQPGVTITARVRARLGALPGWLPQDWFDDQLVQPIMAAPVFTRPMFEALDAYDREWLIPGLATMPLPDMVTALVSNAPFIEGFLTGLSHELGRELLWRGFPTDERGTYFRRFWNGEVDELEQQIHEFTPTPLGSHLSPSIAGNLVLFVRGELIRRYPTAIVLAMRAGGADAQGRPVFIDPTTDATAMAPVLFQGLLHPDMTIVGFALTAAEVDAAAGADGHGWWFVIAEHPTAPRFGLAGEPITPPVRDTLAWADLPMAPGGSAPTFLSGLDSRPITDPTIAGGLATWGHDAALTAHILLRDPARAAFEARTLLGPVGVLP